MIREMTEKDLSRVHALATSCFSDAWSEQSFRDSLNEASAYLVVAEDVCKNVVGYACLYTSYDEGEIVNVAVDPAERQKGYGAALVQALLQRGRALDVKHFFLEVRMSNIAGKLLYTRMGFAECGIRKGFYEKPKEDAVLMFRNESEISQ